MLLLLCSMQMFINVNQVLKDKSPKITGFDFVAITKVITNDNMGGDNTFSASELEDLKKQSYLQDVAPLTGNMFVVNATGGSALPFSSDFFIESIKDDFIDTLPSSFAWKEGQIDVPMIVSSDYLEIYNAVFAPSRDLPQISEKTASSVNIFLECTGGGQTQNFRAGIVALSDRINTVLVPESFMQWANEKFGGGVKKNPSRIYIKTKDANDPALLQYLNDHHYRINKEKTQFGRIKSVLQNIVSALGVFGILVIVLALMLFSFYLQLMIARSKDNLKLLLMLGYSPNWLSKTVAKTWIPVYVVVVLSAIILTAVMQYAFVKISFVENKDVSAFIHWGVIAVAVGLLFLSVFTNYSLLKKELARLD